MTPTLIIPLNDSESPDQAVYRFIVERGLFGKLLHWHYRPDTWADEAYRVVSLVADIRPCIAPGHTLLIRADGSWECKREE